MSKKRSSLPKRSEMSEQIYVMQWAALQQGAYPELEFLFHVPNGMHTTAKVKAQFKRAGLKPGCPDLWLPVPRQGYCGLVIELKLPGEKPRENQIRWLDFLSSEGWYATTCEGGDDAVETIGWYLNGPKTDCSRTSGTSVTKRGTKTTTGRAKGPRDSDNN